MHIIFLNQTGCLRLEVENTNTIIRRIQDGEQISTEALNDVYTLREAQHLLESLYKLNRRAA